VYWPLMRVRRGIINPAKAFRGLLPNVLKSRLNHTTSGFWRCRAESKRSKLDGRSGDQQRRIE
jgi:hypothetical protein